MGFSKELTWFQHLGWSARASKSMGAQTDASAPRTFDAADAMEQGLACELATEFVQPEPESAERRKMRVQRSADRLSYVLFNEEGVAMLIARIVTAQRRVEVFAASQDSLEVRKEQEIVGPAFTLSWDDSTTKWSVKCRCCERCSYRSCQSACEDLGGQTLATMSHFKDEVGDAIALCMNVDVPSVTPYCGRSIWCPLECSSGSSKATMGLTTKKPTWNQKLQTLTMDFKGNVACSSAKNFLLCRGDREIMLYGKQKSDSFCLHFEHPLSSAQAFSIALSTMFWT